jgi:hypothetical protein
MEFIIILVISTGCSCIVYFLTRIVVRRFLKNRRVVRWLPIGLALIVWGALTYYNMTILANDVHNMHGVIQPRHVHDTVIHRDGFIIDSLIDKGDSLRDIEDTARAPVEDTTIVNKVLSVVEKIPGFTDMMVRFTDHYEKDSIRAIEWVEWIPNPHATAAIERKYYSVYVGEDHVDHTSRWYTFLVSKDLKRLLYYDGAYDKIYPASHWKKLWPATKFLKKVK